MCVFQCTASSSSSVNKDWENWVVYHGNDKMAVEDVWGIGKTIGVKFKDKMNMLNNAFSREGRQYLKGSGAQECDEGKEGGGKGVEGFVRRR